MRIRSTATRTTTGPSKATAARNGRESRTAKISKPAKVRAGDVVYRVVEDVTYDGPMTWTMCTRIVKTVRKDGKLVLDRMLPGSFAKLVATHQVSVTEADAIRQFRAQQNKILQLAEGMATRARDALAWAAPRSTTIDGEK